MRVNKQRINFATRSAVALLALSGAPGAVLAEEPVQDGAVGAGGTAEPVAASAPDGNVAKVVVSARRRLESLQDVPVSVTALSADQLSRQGVPDIAALTNVLPNTTLKASRATNSTLTAFIRGVGQADPLAGFESGVGIYLDDIYLARPQGAVADIYDVERIEVLRGPQGTLYGRNTIGGAVKYVTRKLGPKPDVRLRATVGDYKERDGVLTASTPVTDTFRIGATVARFKHDGYGRNLFNGLPNYDKDLTAGRVSAEWTPTPDLFIRVAGDLTQDDSHPKNGHRLTVGRKSGAPILPNVYDTQAEMMTAVGNEQSVRQHGIAATVEWTMSPELVFKSITAQRQDKSWAPIDFDSLAVVDMEVPALYTNRQFSQEFNLTYTGPKIQGVAGVYYIDANAYDRFDTILAGAVATSTFTSGNVNTRAWAAYADGSYNLTDTLQLSLGGRYTVDKREADILRQIYFGLAGTPQMGNPGAILFRTDTNLPGLARTDKKFTPRISLGWKATPEQNVYASYSQGFKGGGFDPRLNVTGTGITQAQARAGYKPETIATAELGLKSSFNGGRVTMNTALFHSHYKDVQIPGSVAIDTNHDGRDDSFAGLTTNAGKATIRGFEFETVAHVTDNFSVTGMYSFIDAKYKEYFVAGVNVAGQRHFQNTPRNSANLRATYEFPLALAGSTGRVALIASASYRGQTYQFEAASPLDQDPYELYDASLLWTRSDGKIRAGVHGKNLSDKHYKTAGYLFPTLGNEGTLTAFYGAPRTVQATVEYRF
jgi:iron complex outermembrane receptor protein